MGAQQTGDQTRSASGAVAPEPGAAAAGAVPKHAYGVKLVRGPFVELAAHPGHVDADGDLPGLCRSLRKKTPGIRLAADLFSGAGGLSLGLRQAGIEVVLSVDHDTEAQRTHTHHFPGMSLDWDLGDASLVERTAGLIRDSGITVLVGGPPCQPFSKAGRSGIRHRVRSGQRDPHDQRRDLWRSFIEVVRLARPEAVIMENVPDMALDTEMFILRSVVEDLEGLGYGVEERVLETWRYGVPQFRQRLIVVGLAGNLAYDWPAEVPEKVTVWNAIGDMPEVEGGWRPDGGAQGWTDYPGPVSSFQRLMRSGVPDGEAGRLYDHITRPVREDDARAFDLMGPGTLYSDLPEDVKRYRDDIFDDKYKRLDENDLSRTITAHIAKDGYWYIHPRQGRTLTVREAARLQTFPDWYRFSGPPSAAFRQIGNAVPPAVGRRLAEGVAVALADPRERLFSTRDVASLLAGWFLGRAELRLPWLRARTRWQLIMAVTLLDRATAEQIQQVWPVLRMWPQPQDAVANAGVLRAMGKMAGRAARVETVLAVAAVVAGDEAVLDDDDAAVRLAGVQRSVAELAVLAVPTSGDDASEEPVCSAQGPRRVAARFLGEPVDRRNQLTDGRLAVARMIGAGSSSRDAQLGLIELAATLCRPVRPVCSVCPLNRWCVSADTTPTLLDDLAVGV